MNKIIYNEFKNVQMDDDYYPSSDGYIELIYWNGGQKHTIKSNKPIYEFLTPKQVHDLYSGERITLSSETIEKYFKKI